MYENAMVPSSWESDDRPTQPCVVCGGIADRLVELPKLPEVHVAFASNGLCRMCAELAQATESELLTQRVQDELHDALRENAGDVPDVVRLVMAWAGHRMPPPAPVDPAYRHHVLQPLSADDATRWSRLEPWTGPAHELIVLRAERNREHEAEMTARRAWFEAHVTATPLVVDGEAVEIMLHDWSDNGSFEASLDGRVDATLARRPRSDESWALSWGDVTERWTDETWDWALQLWDDDGELNDADAELIKTWLTTGTSS